jgi:hypothetical protein
VLLTPGSRTLYRVGRSDRPLASSQITVEDGVCVATLQDRALRAAASRGVGQGVPQTDSPNRCRTALLDSAEKGSGLFVLWWGEHDAEEHMVGQEYQSLHRPRMPGLRQP